MLEVDLSSARMVERVAAEERREEDLTEGV